MPRLFPVQRSQYRPDSYSKQLWRPALVGSKLHFFSATQGSTGLSGSPGFDVGLRGEGPSSRQLWCDAKQNPHLYQLPQSTTKANQRSRGAATVTTAPYISSLRNSTSRSTFCALATTRAPLVENGLTSTTVEATASAATMPMAPTEPSSKKGTASGMVAPSTAIEEAKAETMAPTKQISSAASRGQPTLATALPA